MKVRLSPRTRVLDGGRLLLGGSPLTVQRLRRPVPQTTHDTPLGRRWLDTGIGVPVIEPTDRIAATDLTVVVPVRDRPEQLARCRAALESLRVLVVDDASSTPVAGAMRLDTNLGPAGARNAGLRAVSTPFVAFVDSDVEVTASDLLGLSAHFADPQVSIVAPRVRGRSPRRTWWQRYDAAFSSLDLGPVPAPVRPGSGVSYVPSACLIARTETLGDGFDPSLRVGEDVDLIWRLLEAGHIVRYDPTVIAHHDSRPSLTAWLAQTYGYGTSAAPLSARHGAAVAPARLAPAYAVSALALLGRSRWAVPLIALSAADSVRRLRRSMPLLTAGAVAGNGFLWAVRQEASLGVRHWWPAVAAACLISQRVRRAALSAAVIDTAIALTDRRGLGPATQILGRRTTDLAYGAGVWVGAVRSRSGQALVPAIGALSNR